MNGQPMQWCNWGWIWAAGAADDIFVVGGPTLGGDNLARPGSMAVADGSVYVADRVGEDVGEPGPSEMG